MVLGSRKRKAGTPSGWIWSTGLACSVAGQHSYPDPESGFLAAFDLVTFSRDWAVNAIILPGENLGGRRREYATEEWFCQNESPCPGQVQDDKEGHQEYNMPESETGPGSCSSWSVPSPSRGEGDSHSCPRPVGRS